MPKRHEKHRDKFTSLKQCTTLLAHDKNFPYDKNADDDTNAIASEAVLKMLDDLAA